MTEKVNFITNFPDIERDYMAILNKYFINFRKVVMNRDNTKKYVLNPEHFSCITRGAPVLSPLLGFEPYNTMPDVISFFMRLSQMSVKKTERLTRLYDKIRGVLQYTDSHDSIYTALIRAIDMFRPEMVDTNLMLTIASGCGTNPESYCNAKVFAEYVKLDSIGQLLNHDLSKQLRTEILWAEIEKGLRNDKLMGIPVEEIIAFFEDQPSAIIVKAFDINFIAMNCFRALLNIGNLKAYTEQQIKNFNLQYQYTVTSTATGGEPFSSTPPKSPEEITQQLQAHYLNLQKILDRIIQLGTHLNAYTFGYLLTHAVPEEFLLDSSYMKLCSVFSQIVHGAYTISDVVNVNEWIRMVKHIILLNPSINIPHDVMLDLALTPEEFSLITDGLELGLARYAISYFGGCVQLAYHEMDTELGKPAAEAFLNKTFSEKLSYIFNEVENAEILESVDPLDKSKWVEAQEKRREKGVDFAALLHSEYNFKFYDLKKVFERTQEYVDCLQEMLAAEEEQKL
jgi:hypothetical protein